MTKEIFLGGRLSSLEDVVDSVCFGEYQGWRPLIISLVVDLFEMGWNGRLAQIKEKFGGLRFYVDECDDAMCHRIRVAEQESIYTCMVCGEEGKQRPRPWIVTLCDKHEKEVK